MNTWERGGTGLRDELKIRWKLNKLLVGSNPTAPTTNNFTLKKLK